MATNVYMYVQPVANGHWALLTVTDASLLTVTDAQVRQGDLPGQTLALLCGQDLLGDG